MIRKNFIKEKPASRRSERFEKTLMKEIAQVISQDVKDPGVNALVSILAVKMSKDFEIAYVKVRIFGSDKKDIVKTLDAVRRSAGYISSVVGSQLSLRRSPEIRFEAVDDEEYVNTWLHDSEEGVK
ncbi:MAG: 30S ribosome-binding factor RbfA [Brevinema sp.]